MKICSKCKRILDETNFFADNRKSDKLRCQCKDCCKEYSKSENRKISLSKYNKSDKGKASLKKYRSSDKFKIFISKYKDTEVYKNVKKKYRQSENGKISKRKYDSSLKGKLSFVRYYKSDKWKQKWKFRYYNDIQFRLSSKHSAYIKRSLKSKKNGAKWQEIVGYNVSDLISHLEKQFDSKMSWENYGKYWHIDHIKPISLFKFNSPTDKEFIECWSLKNLQPLEAKENIRKSNKY